MLSQPTQYADAEIFSINYDRLAAGSPGPGRLARLEARVRSGSLDRALIAGANPTGSPQLAARAAQLTSRRTRTSVADGLERLVEVAEGPPRRWSAVSRSGPLLANATEIRALAAVLRDGKPVNARGIATLNQLLTDGAGAAYQGAAKDLARVLHEARVAVEYRPK